MDFHLERELRFHTEPKHKNLYKWAINEISADGKLVGHDQIPWEWSLYFTATSCSLSNSWEVRHPLAFKYTVAVPDGTRSEQEAGNGKERITTSQVIRAVMRPGSANEASNDCEYSMFGTDRTIGKFELCIYPLANPGDPESCNTWGCPSYTSEGPDYGDETTEDCIAFNMLVAPETFARYVTNINAGFIDEITLRVGRVDGFYSEWSPSVSTDRVKVLTADREHKLTIPEDHPFSPPRLGRVGEVALVMNRHLNLEADPHGEAGEKRTELRAQRKIPISQSSVEPQILNVLKSVKRAAWLCAWALGLLFLLMLRR